MYPLWTNVECQVRMSGGGNVVLVLPTGEAKLGTGWACTELLSLVLLDPWREGWARAS